ncbi:unnamed protein product [Gadus morhua 'NCC']
MRGVICSHRGPGADQGLISTRSPGPPGPGPQTRRIFRVISIRGGASSRIPRSTSDPVSQPVLLPAVGTEGQPDTGRPAWTDSPKRRARGRASEAGRYYILPPAAPRWICPELVVLVDSVLMVVLVVVGSLLIMRAGSLLIMMTAASPLLAEWTEFRRTRIYSGALLGGPSGGTQGLV